jgi:hypothetical protein
MPKDAHTSDAYDHQRAAKSHRAAALESNRGAHDAWVEHVAIACGHSAKAYEASKPAHEKSVERIKSVAVAAK